MIEEVEARFRDEEVKTVSNSLEEVNGKKEWSE